MDMENTSMTKHDVEQAIVNGKVFYQVTQMGINRCVPLEYVDYSPDNDRLFLSGTSIVRIGASTSVTPNTFFARIEDAALQLQSNVVEWVIGLNKGDLATAPLAIVPASLINIPWRK